ncbi:recombinase family protein [Arthrobacter sp. NicSoilB8]|uniref:recombinase family protein n=1 Tax=Arthrobacter sp. NicSoilB8 TaxID=2830998 RepID=UPI001CC741FA|nr:recombinase family protein [Arthrobacter sp. NicSoilB8]BCW70790.1 hypothetical protein NicSoilB8_18340 [Arthrobacter sp. NicSoilB8]
MLETAVGPQALTGVGPEGLINGDHGLTGRNNERPGPNEALAAGRAGIAPVVTKPDRSARPNQMLENIIEGMTRISQEFQRPTGTITRI